MTISWTASDVHAGDVECCFREYWNTGGCIMCMCYRRCKLKFIMDVKIKELKKKV